MKVPAFIPTAPEVLREAVIVMAGALLAVVIVRQLPKAWQSWFDISSLGGAKDGTS